MRFTSLSVMVDHHKETLMNRHEYIKIEEMVYSF